MIEKKIESLLPELYEISYRHTSDNVKNAAALAADALLMFLDLSDDEQRGARVSA